MELIYRSFDPELEVRSGGDGRTIYGLAVPWGRAVRIDARLTERFATGTFNHQLRAANRVRFAREHVKLGGSLIGVTRLLRNDTAGLYGEWYVSRTPLGDESLELAKDGALRQLSVGFRERPNGTRRVPGGITERVKADLFEVALVMQGAFGEDAAVAGVRSAADGTCDVCGCACGGNPNLHRAAELLARVPALPAVTG